jgi:hypothetical protein
MESLRSMINFLPPRMPSDAKFLTEDKIKESCLSLCFLATFAVKLFK